LRVLLDTHVFIWFNLDDPRLSARARQVIMDGQNTVLLSVASAWEIAIKASLGRMPDIGVPPAEYVPDRMRHYGLEGLSVQMAHALRVAELPHHHGDPFDRLLVAQALVEGLPIVTGDENIPRYGVEVVW
jgi:PIN domain nuclease of toxin-antitoxin system